MQSALTLYLKSNQSGSAPGSEGRPADVRKRPWANDQNHRGISVDSAIAGPHALLSDRNVTAVNGLQKIRAPS
jgi:hypothetical protein